MGDIIITPDASLNALAGQIKIEHEAALGSARTALKHALRAGELLLEAKALVKHGQWLPWLSANVDVSERQAQKYMQLALNRPALEAKAPSEADLTIGDALELIAKPKEATPLEGHPVIEEARLALRRCLDGFEAEADALAEPWRTQALTRVVQDAECQVMAERLSFVTKDDEFSILAAKIWLRAKARLEPITVHSPPDWAARALLELAHLKAECSFDKFGCSYTRHPNGRVTEYKRTATKEERT